MTETQKEIMNSLMAGLERGELTPAQLCQGITDLIGQNSRKPQDILYLQARNTSPESQVVGMMRIEGGKRGVCPPDPEDWALSDSIGRCKGRLANHFIPQYVPVGCR